MTYRPLDDWPVCPDSCCVVGMDYDDFNPAGRPGSEVPRPMFQVLQDIVPWYAIEAGAGVDADDGLVLIEYDEVVPDWDFARPDPRERLADELVRT